MVPLTQFIAEVKLEDDDIEQMDIAFTPPDVLEVEEEPPPPKEEEEPPEMEETPDLSLEQLELSLNPGMGGDLAGDFALPGMGIGKADLDISSIFDLDDLDKQPRALNQPPPRYPRAFMRKKISGFVKLMFVVDENGKARDIEVLESTHKDFADAAVEAVKRWKFEPGTKNGEKVRTRVRIPIPFNIK
ncbi:MAG: energy transducer TonB [Puniceicoccales bacterium]